MRIDIVTLLPDLLRSPFEGSIMKRAIDKGFVLSDHCDWTGLLESIKATGAERVISTHGYSDIFSKYLRELGYDARTATTQYEGEAAEMGKSESELEEKEAEA